MADIGGGGSFRVSSGVNAAQAKAQNRIKSLKDPVYMREFVKRQHTKPDLKLVAFMLNRTDSESRSVRNELRNELPASAIKLAEDLGKHAQGSDDAFVNQQLGQPTLENVNKVAAGIYGATSDKTDYEDSLKGKLEDTTLPPDQNKNITAYKT